MSGRDWLDVLNEEGVEAVARAMREAVERLDRPSGQPLGPMRHADALRRLAARARSALPPSARPRSRH